MARRRFNIERAKRGVMGVSAFVLGAWSALTGIGAQAAAGPYIVFMLGYSPLKAGATASLFAFGGALGGVTGWLLVSQSALPVTTALWAAVGATVGVVAAALLPGFPRFLRRLGQSLMLILMLFVVAEGTRVRFEGVPHLQWPVFREWYGVLLAGAACGFAAHVFALPAGVLLVPGFVFGLGLAPSSAIAVALCAAAVAAVVPVAGLLANKAADALVGPAMCLGGVVGGLAGGAFLAARAGADSTWPLASFGATAMVLTAWLAYRAE